MAAFGLRVGRLMIEAPKCINKAGCAIEALGNFWFYLDFIPDFIVSVHDILTTFTNDHTSENHEFISQLYYERLLVQFISQSLEIDVINILGFIALLIKQYCEPFLQFD